MAFDLSPPEDDGLLIEKMQPWAADKHHFLRRYVDAFTTSMKSKRWNGLHYIDLFAGAGIGRVEGGGLEWGSPLIATQAPNRFTRIHLCEKNRRKFNALSQRVGRHGQPSGPQLICGDANQAVQEVVKSLPLDALSVAFLDPYGLHLHFDTLRALSSRQVDLIIFFPDHLDALRNLHFVYQGQPDSNLDKVLGTRRWREMTNKKPQNQWAQTLQEIYQQQIRELGYSQFEEERISNRGIPLYKLMFCARHPTASRLWRNTSRKHRDGQNRLFG